MTNEIKVSMQRHYNELINSCANFGQTNSKRAVARTHNKAFAIAGVPCFADTFVQEGGYIFTEKNGVVAMESEHYFETKATGKTKWTVIPDLGRTLSGIALMPYNEKTENAGITYKMHMKPKSDSIKVWIFFDSALPFKKGGHNVAASFIGGNEKVWNINEDLNWENKYTKMYPTGAARMIENTIMLNLPNSKDGIFDLTIRPLDPGVVIYKVIVDNGGYVRTHLNMQESPYNKQ